MLCFVNLIINKALREIKTLQRVTNLFLSRLFFQKVMKNIMRDQTTKDLRIQRNAVNVLQETIEEFLVKTFESKLIIIIIDHTRFDVDFSRLMREHLCKICMREKSLKKRKTSFYASSERSRWASYSTYYVYFLLYLWLFFLLS
jgi:histone H3/H4